MSPTRPHSTPAVSRRARQFWRGSPRPLRGRLLLAGCLAVSTLNLACDQGGGGAKTKDSQSQRRMYLSSGEFNKGYQDGKRDAAASLFDASGAWMWTWMKEGEYSKGYDQGWNDGRQMKKLQGQQKTQQQEQGPQLQKARKQLDQATMKSLAKQKRAVQVSVKDKERK